MMIPQPKYKMGERVYYTVEPWKYGVARTATALIEAIEYEAKSFIDLETSKTSVSVHYHLSDGTRKHESKLYTNNEDI